jgi:hypothetical protein
MIESKYMKHKKSKKVKQKKFSLLFTTFIVALILLIGISYVEFNKNQRETKITEDEHISYVESPVDISDRINTGKDTYSLVSLGNGLNKFTSHEANFSFEYPNDLRLYDYLLRGINMGRKIILCSEDIIKRSDVPYMCPSGGIFIWYDGDGWGGGCDQEMLQPININNKKTKYCENPPYFGGLNTRTSSHRFLVEGVYSQSFTKETFLQIIHSMKFWD